MLTDHDGRSLGVKVVRQLSGFGREVRSRADVEHLARDLEGAGTVGVLNGAERDCGPAAVIELARLRGHILAQAGNRVQLDDKAKLDGELDP